MILAGDVGGTKTNLACFRSEGKSLTVMAQRSVRSADFPGLEAIIKTFLAELPADLEGACFGVAGAVVDGRCRTTNLPWMVDARALRDALGLESVWLINDLEATAYGIQTLPERACVVLQDGLAQPHGNIAVIAAGTGLGEAMLFWDGRGYRAIASEGGHADFGPRTALERELCGFLAERFGHVSYERVLSGPGLVNIYQFLKAAGQGEEPAWLTAQLATGDPSAAISTCALEGRADLCVKALELFASIYGAEAGNLALKALSLNGLFVGGGIAPKILDKLKDGAFIKAFNDKGRLAVSLSRIPVRVILEPLTALHGAAHYGFSQISP